MGKIGGFLEYDRKDSIDISPKQRICNFAEFHLPINEEERKNQASRCMDCGVPFCQFGQEIAGMSSGCPLHNMIPEWNDLLYRGNYDEALKRLLLTNPFPEFTSRVCPAPCEKACTCSLHGDAVTICENEKFLIEYGFDREIIKAKQASKRSGKKIAIVGSGPSGLATAWQLNRRGHEVTVYERSDRAGGLLMYGIPNMKLDKEYVNRRIALMEEEGITFVLSTSIDTPEAADKLKSEYDAVVLAVGASKPRDLQVANREATGIHFAVDYLQAATKHVLDANDTEPTIDANNKHVLVIGGGDTGNDCVGTAIRQHCASVMQLEMMPELPSTRQENNPWPEWPKVKKTDYGQEEAIAVFGKDPRVYEAIVKEFVKNEAGEVCQAIIVDVAWQLDENKRMQPVHVADSERVVDCDLVFIAAGFVGVENNVCTAFMLDQTERGVLATTDGTATAIDGVFVTGDAKRGQSLVVWAMQEGKNTARAVDTYLMGYSNL